jgi:hypothetical protein
MRKGTFIFGVVLVLLAYWYWVEPFASEKKTRLVSTPAPFARYEPDPVVVGPRQTACLDRIGLQPAIGQALVRTLRGTGALELTLRTEDYEARASARVPAKPGDVVFRVKGPRSDALGEACIRNTGRDAVTLSASQDPRIATRSATRVDGKLVGPDVGLTFLEPEPESLFSMAGSIVDRMSTWKPFFMDAWLAWLLFPLVVVGIPAGLFWAYASSREVP